jgi:poly(3-hydroxybutyrate) depolymerase
MIVSDEGIGDEEVFMMKFSMQKFLGLTLLLTWSVQAQTVNVRGKVIDGTGKAVANAIAEILTLNLKDTTGADGAFSLKTPPTGLMGAARIASGAMVWNRGVLNVSLAKPTSLKVEIVDIHGQLLHREQVRETSIGNVRIDLRDKLPTNQLALVRASMGDEVQTFQYLPMSIEGESGHSLSASIPMSTRVAKVAATLDSLKIAAEGFATQTIALSAYDTTVNVTMAPEKGKTSPGCGISTSLKSGNFTETIDGKSRKWMLDVPTNYDGSKPYRLIFVWHPLGGSGSQVVNGGYNGLKSLANNTAIFATADGLQGSNSETSGVGWWNAGGGDMKLVQAMLDKIKNGLCVDQERIFSTGFSFGGMMSYTLPYEFDDFRAIAPCSGKTGVIPFTEKFTRPVPIMAFHGNTDTFVATNLGKAFFDKYAARNTCGTQTQAVSPNGCVEYQGCSESSTWCLFNGGHTTWSEQPAAIWKFFSQY